MTFWKSEMGEVTGSAKDSFTEASKTIPDGTKSFAKIDAFNLQKNSVSGEQYYNIEWTITSDEFKGRKVWQKIKAFDAKIESKHRALNMLKLIYNLFSVKPTHADAPTDKDLLAFVGKIAGIKIQETDPHKETGKQYNWVSEVHSSQGFKTETGVKLVVTHKVDRDLDSAFSRNRDHVSNTDMSGEDIPF